MKKIFRLYILIITTIIGLVFVKYSDFIYKKIHNIKVDIKTDILYRERHEKIIDLEGRIPFEVSQNDQLWFNQYHFISHSGGGIGGRIYTNSKEAWKQNYEMGNRVFDADLFYTKDGYLVLRHEWIDNPETSVIDIENSFGTTDDSSLIRIKKQTIPDYEVFMNSKIYQIYHAMDILDMLEFMVLHPDIYVSCNVKEDYAKTYQLLVDLVNKNYSSDLLDRLIVNIYHPSNFNEIIEVYPFKNFVLRQYLGKENNYYEMVDFCLKNNIYVVSLSAVYAEDEGIQLLKNYGIVPMVAVCDYISDMQYYHERGIDHAVTNWLHESDWKYIEE